MRDLVRAMPASLVLSLASACSGPGASVTPPDAADEARDASFPDARDGGDDAGAGDGGAAIGAPCESPDDNSRGTCATGLTCLTEARGYPQGYCAGVCDAGACAPGATCVTPGPLGATCLRGCARNSDCRTLEGYVCSAVTRTCRLTDAPVGTRDGAACFTTEAGPTSAMALPRRTFATPNRSLSAARTDSASEADGNVVFDPARDAIVTPYIAIPAGGSFIGTTRAPALDGALTTARTGDPVQLWNADPLVIRLRDGTLRASFMGYRFGGFISYDTRMWVAASADGSAWEAPRAVDPEGTCAIRCDKPTIASGTLFSAPAREAVYVAYQVEQRENETGVLVVQRSDDNGATWTRPSLLAPVEEVAGVRVAPQLVALTVADDGAVHAVYAGIPLSGLDATLWGNRGARILHRVSRDGGATWSAAHSVARAGTDTPVYIQPSVVRLGAKLHVAWVDGTPDGAWNVMLSTSADGGTTWRTRAVNDDPSNCATHTLPALAADPARAAVHVLWIENRFGDGMAAYAMCPDDPTRPCGANERVSDAGFTFTTSRDPTRWHGDYVGITVDAGGALHAVWSDTRTGSPAVYAARGVVP